MATANRTSKRARRTPADKAAMRIPPRRALGPRTWLLVAGDGEARIYDVEPASLRLTARRDGRMRPSQTSDYVPGVAGLVNNGARHRKFDALLVAAPPKVMTNLLRGLSAAARRRVALEIRLPWTRLSTTAMTLRLMRSLLAA
ncbi:MAG: hypothetical protein SFV19_20555 [Rhodospirillaceae bacterium]|nr:hypothetical protein [Rhodospirillaceae bacterium]